MILTENKKMISTSSQKVESLPEISDRTFKLKPEYFTANTKCCSMERTLNLGVKYIPKLYEYEDLKEREGLTVVYNCSILSQEYNTNWILQSQTIPTIKFNHMKTHRCVNMIDLINPDNPDKHMQIMLSAKYGQINIASIYRTKEIHEILSQESYSLEFEMMIFKKDGTSEQAGLPSQGDDNDALVVFMITINEEPYCMIECTLHANYGFITISEKGDDYRIFNCSECCVVCRLPNFDHIPNCVFNSMDRSNLLFGDFGNKIIGAVFASEKQYHDFLKLEKKKQISSAKRQASSASLSGMPSTKQAHAL